MMVVESARNERDLHWLSAETPRPQGDSRPLGPASRHSLSSVSVCWRDRETIRTMSGYLGLPRPSDVSTEYLR